MGATETSLLVIVAIVVVTIISKRLLPGGTQTFHLLRRHRLAREASREVGSACDYQTRVGAEISESTGAPPDAIGDRTWADLDLDEVFLNPGRAVSGVGRQYLYH